MTAPDSGNSHEWGPRMEVPARKGRAVLLRRGETLAVRDVDGAQVADLFAFVAEDPTEHLSASHTRAALRRLFPAIGESFFTNRRRPILTLVSDTSPGIHDLLIAACDPERYRQLGAEGHHDSCEENLRENAAAVGFTPAFTPQPVNLFMNTPPMADGRIDYREAESGPGDRVELRAELDAYVVVSACPMDLIQISGGGPTSLELERIS